MENEKVMETKTQYKFEKEAQGWGDSANNYVVPRELTVTITLREYRELLTKSAEEETQKNYLKWIEADNQVVELKKKVEMLEEMLGKRGEDTESED